MELYQHADSEATSRLIQSLGQILYRFLVSQLANRAEAEDLVQEVLLRIHKCRHTYRKGAPVLPWAFAIARHVRIDDYRKRRRTSIWQTPLDNVPEPISGPEPSRHPLPDLTTLIAHLPDSQREVIVMLKVGGLSLEQVARATSSTVGAVKQKAHRAYASLRLQLANSAVGLHRSPPSC